MLRQQHDASSLESTIEGSRLADNGRLASTATAAGATVRASNAAGHVPVDDRDDAGGATMNRSQKATPPEALLEVDGVARRVEPAQGGGYERNRH